MTLYEAYKKPSDIKKSVWEYWCKWAKENGFEQPAIRSHNAQMFTIRMYKWTEQKGICMDIFPTRIARLEVDFETGEKITYTNYKI